MHSTGQFLHRLAPQFIGLFGTSGSPQKRQENNPNNSFQDSSRGEKMFAGYSAIVLQISPAELNMPPNLFDILGVLSMFGAMPSATV